jgi:hypothetical protein
VKTSNLLWDFLSANHYFHSRLKSSITCLQTKLAHRIYLMTDKLSSSDLRRYAMLGAEARLAELDKETASIYQAFPELRKHRGARSVPAAAGVVAAARTGQRRRRRTMSAAQREEVRQRMKRYWAQRRSAAGATQGEAAGAKAGRAAGKRGRRKMSAAARKRISDAQKARWARRKKANA